MADRIKGITIEIDGNTTKLTKALEGVNKEIKTTQGQLKDVNKLLKMDPGNMDLLRQKQDLLGKAVGETKDKLSTLKEALKQMDASGVDKTSSEYQGLQREIISTEKDLKDLEKASNESNAALGKIGATASSVAAGARKVADATKGLSTAAAGAIGGLVTLGLKAANDADELNTLSKKTGLSTEALQKMRYASSLLDVDVESITGAVAKMKKQLDSGADKFGAIGVAVKDANGEYRNTEAIFNDVVAAIGKIENETERDIVAMDIFGKSADELAGILDDGGQALKELGDEADSLGLIIPQEDIDKANELNDTLDKTKAQLSASIGEAALSTLQALAPVIEKVSEAVQKVAQKLSTVSPQTMQIVLAVLAVIAAISPVAALIANIATAVSFLTPAISALNAALAANPVALVVMAIAALVAIFVTLWNNCEEFREFWINLWEKIKSIVTGAWEAITGFLSEIWGKITGAVTGFADGVKEKFSNIKDAAEEKFTAMKDKCAEIWGNIKNVASEKWNQVKDVTSTVLNACKETAQESLNKMKKAYEENGGGIKGIVAATMTGIKEKYLAGFNVINKLTGGKLGEIKDKIFGKFQEIIDKAKTWGKDLIDNFVGGIKDKISAVSDAVGNIAKTVKDFLGFSEPDKGPLSNFHTFMPDMIDLMTKGIDQNMYKVQSSMDALASSMVPDPSINVNYDDSNLRGSLDGLSRSMGNLNTNVTVVLEGDARDLWKVVRQQNDINTKAKGRNAFA